MRGASYLYLLVRPLPSMQLGPLKQKTGLSGHLCSFFTLRTLCGNVLLLFGKESYQSFAYPTGMQAHVADEEGMGPAGWKSAMAMHCRMCGLSIEITAAATGSLIYIGRLTRNLLVVSRERKVDPHGSPCRLQSNLVITIFLSVPLLPWRNQQGKWQLALGFLQQEKQAYEDASGHRRASHISCNSAVSACGLSSQWAQAVHVFESMEGAVDGISLSACISACEKGNRWEKAVCFSDQLGRTMPRAPRQTRFDLQCLSVALTACISACEKGYEWQRSLQMASDVTVL